MIALPIDNLSDVDRTHLTKLDGQSQDNSSANWAQFHGPGGLGVSTESVPLTWSDENSIVWKTALPGHAQSKRHLNGKA